MRRGLIAAAGAAAVTMACASASPPPGGPEDQLAPAIVRVTPDTNAVNVTAKVVSFQFNETINDRGTGAGELSNFFIISPTDGNAHVSYHRSRIDVRPRGGFRPNTAYTVTLLPGLSDLRNNTMRSGATVVFSTGPTIPAQRIAGTVFDWVGERAATRAFVTATTPDSVTYLAYTDSLGQFTVGPLPAGSYLVRAAIDANNNRAADRNEATDSARVTVPSAKPLELLAIVRDTLPPRIGTPSQADSVSLRVPFDRPLDPGAIPGPAAFRVVGPDSVAIAVTAVLTPKQEADLALARSNALADSARRADSLAGRRPPVTAPAPAVPLPTRSATVRPVAKPSVAAPPTTVLLRLARPLAPGTVYRVSVTSARALSGRSAASERTFTTPRPPAPRPAADSAGRRGAPRVTRPAPPSGTPAPKPE